MKRNALVGSFLKLVIAVFLPAITQQSLGAEAVSLRPNIIVVLVDDMGWGDLSCFGNREIKTPNIDRLASEGIRFERFYVNSPICSPSRVAISTGQYPPRWRITSFLSDRDANERRGIAQWLDPKAPMLARILREAGYTTGHFGKWHLGGQRDVGNAPMINEYGFDASLTNFEGLGPRVLPLLDAFDGEPPSRYSLGSASLNKGPIHWERRDKVTGAFVTAAIKFVDNAQKKGQPFYINLWPDDVHSPFYPPMEVRDDSSKRKLYLSVLHAMDAQLRPLFDRIRNDNLLRDNTLVLFCSDNGPEEGAGSAGKLRGFKAMLYEGGIRSPFIIWGPGLVAADKVGTTNTSSLFSAIDIAPSILQLAGIAKPNDVEFDGEPLADVLLGRSERARSKPLYFRRPPDRPRHNGEGRLPDLCVIDGQWKLFCDYDGAEPELYNLTSDRGETSNIAKNNHKVVERLRAALLAWNNSMPSDNGPISSDLSNFPGRNRARAQQRN
jgi:uncharacterized sulfatase